MGMYYAGPTYYIGDFYAIKMRGVKLTNRSILEVGNNRWWCEISLSHPQGGSKKY